MTTRRAGHDVREPEATGGVETRLRGADDEPLLRAAGLTLRGARGDVYADVSLSVRPGELVALVGPQGSGRTALLLTLAGRMAPSRGDLTVLGHRLPRGRRDVQHHAALVNIAAVDDLEESLTVGEVVRERAGLSVPLWRKPLGLRDERMGELRTQAFGPADPPRWDTRIWQLTPLQELQTKILLGLVGGPRLLVVDDVDAVRDPDQVAAAWATLVAVAASGVAVVAATTHDGEVPSTVVRASTVDRATSTVDRATSTVACATGTAGLPTADEAPAPTPTARI